MSDFVLYAVVSGRRVIAHLSVPRGDAPPFRTDPPIWAHVVYGPMITTEDATRALAGVAIDLREEA